MKGEARRGTLQDTILTVATELFIRHGYKAVSFLAIARELGITHSHVHYYFGTKALLAEAVLETYVANTIADFRSIWTANDLDLLGRFVRSRDWIWRQYVKFNPGGVGGNDWGLLARFAGESDLLTPAVRKRLATTMVTMNSFIETGIDMAVRHGELVPDTPKHALVMQISSLLHTSRHTTRIEGSFDRLDELLRWTLDVIQRAYGTGTPTGAWPSVVSVQAGQARDATTNASGRTRCRPPMTR